jgi:gamma-glutamyltranspeptidase/glutathione hydrolase
LNNEMDDFSIQPGVPNHFGLVGTEANAVAAGKRPLSSMTPTLVFKGGEPMLAIGAAGGPKIISTVLLELVGLLDLNQTPFAALAAPRIHHQWAPDELWVEPALAPEIKQALAMRGQKVVETKLGAVSHLVMRGKDGKTFIGAADPRAGGIALGW